MSKRLSAQTPFSARGRIEGARHTNQTVVQLAECANPRVQSWINYYGAIYGSALHSILRPLNDHLVRWARRKYKRLGRRRGQAYVFMKRICQRPTLFADWRIGVMPWVGCHEPDEWRCSRPRHPLDLAVSNPVPAEIASFHMARSRSLAQETHRLAGSDGRVAVAQLQLADGSFWVQQDPDTSAAAEVARRSDCS